MSDVHQNELFEAVRPRARSTDPDTSRDAAAAKAKSCTRQATQILEALRGRLEGCNLAELIRITGIPVQTISPYMRPLVRAGLVRDTGVRRVGDFGRAQIVWALVEDGDEQ